MLHNIKTCASLRGGREDGCYARRDVRKPSWPKLCVLKKTWPEFAQLRRQFTAELPTSLLADRKQRDVPCDTVRYVGFKNGAQSIRFNRGGRNPIVSHLGAPR